RAAYAPAAAGGVSHTNGDSRSRLRTVPRQRQARRARRRLLASRRGRTARSRGTTHRRLIDLPSAFPSARRTARRDRLTFTWRHKGLTPASQRLYLTVTIASYLLIPATRHPSRVQFSKGTP